MTRPVDSPTLGDALLPILCNLSIHDNKRMGESKMTHLLSGAARRPVSPDGRAADEPWTHHRRMRDASDLLDSRAVCFGTQSRCSATESGKCPMSFRSAPHGTYRLAEETQMGLPQASCQMGLVGSTFAWNFPYSGFYLSRLPLSTCVPNSRTSYQKMAPARTMSQCDR